MNLIYRARHRGAGLIMRHEETAILLLVMATGLLMGSVALLAAAGISLCP